MFARCMLHAIINTAPQRAGWVQDEVVKAVAGKVGKSAAQVLLRWAVQHGTSLLPKSVSPLRLKARSSCTHRGPGPSPYGPVLYLPSLLCMPATHSVRLEAVLTCILLEIQSIVVS